MADIFSHMHISHYKHRLNPKYSALLNLRPIGQAFSAKLAILKCSPTNDKTYICYEVIRHRDALFVDSLRHLYSLSWHICFTMKITANNRLGYKFTVSWDITVTWQILTELSGKFILLKYVNIIHTDSIWLLDIRGRTWWNDVQNLVLELIRLLTICRCSSSRTFNFSHRHECVCRPFEMRGKVQAWTVAAFRSRPWDIIKLVSFLFFFNPTYFGQHVGCEGIQTLKLQTDRHCRRIVTGGTNLYL
jgi:hypothetical protein